MVLVRVSGGLGNQMFQYAIAKSIAKKNNDIFKLDISFYSNQKLRKFELNEFDTIINFASRKEIIEFAGNENIFFKIKRKLGFIMKRPKSYFPEKEATIFDESVFNYSENIYLDGYWQNSKFFNNIRSELIEDFSFVGQISNSANIYLNKIKAKQSVSIHIRRGDYVSNQKANSIHGVTSLEYYKKAIEFILKKIENPYFFIFSDDINWCKNNFEFLENKEFIDNTNNAFEDLELMKNCKHNIIANSTFSWWGAWLNQNDKKIVISPKIWWVARVDKNLALEDWIKI